MGVNVFPAPSGAALPTGATSRIAAGYARSGYAKITGSFPAGRYMLVSDTAATANFTNIEGVSQFQNFVPKGGRSCIINVTSSTNSIEYMSFRSVNEISRNLNTNSNNSINSAVAVNGISYATVPQWANNGSIARSFPYQDYFITVSTSGDIRWTKTFESWPGAPGSMGFNSWSNTHISASVATNGTRWVMRGSNSVIIYTNNPLSTSGWQQVSHSGSTYFMEFGGGTFINYGGGTVYFYSTDNGANWSTGTFPFGVEQNRLAYGNGVWVITGSGSQPRIAYSTNGTSWTEVTAPRPYYTNTNDEWGAVKFGHGRFVATFLGNNSTTSWAGYKSIYSLDGINWTAVDIPNFQITTAANFQRSSLTFDGAYFRWYSEGQANIRGAMSLDGIDWTIIPFDGMGINSTRLADRAVRGLVPNGTDNGAPFIVDIKEPYSKFEIYALDSSYTTY